jgi:tetratricopeptide (TPR) repeat protein
MKRVLIVIFFFLPLTLTAVDPDSLYQSANQLYQDGSYERALEIYREINNSGIESSGLYYNMGNAAFRSNSIGYAILYFEKALKLDPSHDDAQHNLEFVTRYRLDAFDEVPELFLKTWINLLINSLSEKTWSLLSFLTFVLILVSLLFYLFSRRLALKKTGFVLALVALLLFFVSFTSAISNHKNIIQPAEGIILAPSVVVRSSPSTTGTELFILHEGTKIKLNEEVSGWHNIRVVDGREGWIVSDDFGTI